MTDREILALPPVEGKPPAERLGAYKRLLWEVCNNPGTRAMGDNGRSKSAPLPHQEDILRLLRAYGALTLHELGDRVGLTKEGVRYNCNIMQRRGLLTFEERGQQRIRYWMLAKGVN